MAMTEARKAYQRERYKKFRDQGLCGKCGKRWAEAGHSYCGVCRSSFEKSRNRPGAREALNEYKRKQKAERRKNWLCVNCGKPLKPEELGVNSNCKRCRAVNMESCTVRRMHNRIHGIPRPDRIK